MTLNSNHSADQILSSKEKENDPRSEAVLSASIHKNLTDKEIDKSIAHANNLIGVIEQHKPSSSYYRVISDELHGRMVTANGFKYPYAITEKDSLFPQIDDQIDNSLLGNADST
ncbi:MAG: hypothetical protein WBJ81_00195 [Rickettsiales bacterium]